MENQKFNVEQLELTDCESVNREELLSHTFYCKKCLGYGGWPEMITAGHGDYRTLYIECPECNGTGFDKKKLMDAITEE